MKGEVEIWYKNKLVAKESNLIVNGAGETLASLMTVNPALSGVATASALLDCSNYNIQAISFGTGKDAFTANAHNTGSPAGTIQIRQIQHWDDTGEEALLFVNFSGIDGSAYIPEAGLPEDPNPESTRLEMRDTTTYQQLPADLVNVSSYFTGNGQLVNLLPSALVLNRPETSGINVVNGKIIGSTLGCFPPHGVTTSAIAIFPDGQELSALIGSSTFNSASSMDISGFVTMLEGGANPVSGLIKTGTPPFANGVRYYVDLGPGDLQCANLYGGIYHLGLWTIDLEQSCINGNSAPFSFDVLNNPRKYRLFARKGFSIDITKTEDSGTDAGFNNYAVDEDLRIFWTLKFY